VIKVFNIGSLNGSPTQPSRDVCPQLSIVAQEIGLGPRQYQNIFEMYAGGVEDS
jgi:hypothetical protein